jgi:hypothetical protein
MRIALADPDTGRIPSNSVLSHVFRPGGCVATGECGWLRALVECGALYIESFKSPATIAELCEPWELGEAGYPCSWYWLAAPRDVAAPHLSRDELLLLHALHDRGVDAPDEQIVRRVSYLRPCRAPEPTAQPP